METGYWYGKGTRAPVPRLPKHYTRAYGTGYRYLPVHHPTRDSPKLKTQIVTELREQKADPCRVQCTVGGNLIDFPRAKATKVAELVTIKCLLNNIISTTNARAACIDLKDFYLNNIPPTPEYVFYKAD
jgi:hypothetical protein